MAGRKQRHILQGREGCVWEDNLGDQKAAGPWLNWSPPPDLGTCHIPKYISNSVS